MSGGWPADWWANHRSPFPLMTAVEMRGALVPQMAVFHENRGARSACRDVQATQGPIWLGDVPQGIPDGHRQQDAGSDISVPDPSALRTAYVAAYLQIGAPKTSAGFSHR